MYHDCRTAVAEHGARIVAEGHIWCDDANVGGAVSRNDQSEIRNIAGGCRVVVMICVGGWTEVRSSRLEIGGLTLGGLMNVDGVLSDGESFDVEFDFYSVDGFGKGCGTDGLALGILEFSDDGLGSRVRVSFLCDGLPCGRKAEDDGTQGQFLNCELHGDAPD